MTNQLDAFSEYLLAAPDEGVPRALEELRATVQSLDDASYQAFVAILQQKAAQEQQNLASASSYDDGFGEGFEADLWRATSGAYGQRQGACSRRKTV